MIRPLRFAGTTVALAGVLLAGCTLEPAYQRPDASVPPAFPQGVGPYPAASVAATPVARTPWKTVFSDPKLQGLIETGLAQNRDLRATIANVQAAHAQFQVQRSQLFPTLSATGSATWARQAFLPGESLEAREYSLGGAVPAWELDLFGRLRSLSKAAFEQYLASDEGRRSAQLTLVAEIAEAYLTLAGDRSLLAVSRQTQKSGQESLDLAQSRLDAGVATQLDVDQARTIVEQAQASAASYAVSAAQAKNALDRLVGEVVAEDRTPSGLDEAIMNSLAEVPAGMSSDILLSRPDVLQAEHTLRAANADIGAARAAFFPSISLTGNAGQESQKLSELFKGANSVWSFGPSVSLPLFTGGQNTANLKLSQATRDAAVATYQGAVQTAFREVADALALRGGSAEQLAAQEALVQTSADALKISTARYERGADTYLNTLDAQRTLYSAQLGLVSIQLNRAVNLVDLYRALGGGLV